MRCLLCDRVVEKIETWTGLFSRRQRWTTCASCMAKFERVSEQAYEGIRTIYVYNEAMRDWLHRLKFSQDAIIAHVFADEIKKLCSHYKKAVIVPIPMHPAKKRARTFAHVDVLLEAAGVRYTHLLEKTTTDTQSQKSRVERENSATLFTRNAIQLRKDTHLVLVDDIVTTGTTIRHALKVLKRDGFTHIEVLVFISARM